MSEVSNFQFPIFNKLKILFKKPKVIIVTGEGRRTAKEAIFQVLKPHFKVGNEVLIFETDLTPTPNLGVGGEKFKFSPRSQPEVVLRGLIKKSSLPILVVTQVGDIPPDKDFFAGDREKTIRIREIARTLPAYGYLILNFDDETVREIKNETNLKELTFGFQEGADFRVSDVKLNTGTNFKINYQGNIVPIWLDYLFGKEHIYAALAVAAVGTIFGLNLVEISQALKNYQGLPGKTRLIKGIKNSWILDDSESATVFSMIEALEILGKIEIEKIYPERSRRIAVLGDVIGIGKYTVEAHEAIGEKVARNSDLLFTFGERAKFIARGAESKGMALDSTFPFDKIEEGKIRLRDEIKEGDLILVDGSKEMEMAKIVKEIKV